MNASSSEYCAIVCWHKELRCGSRMHNKRAGEEFVNCSSLTPRRWRRSVVPLRIRLQLGGVLVWSRGPNAASSYIGVLSPG